MFVLGKLFVSEDLCVQFQSFQTGEFQAELAVVNARALKVKTIEVTVELLYSGVKVYNGNIGELCRYGCFQK